MTDTEYDDTERVRTRTVIDILESHGVRAMVASDSTVVAYVEATQLTENGPVNASGWEALPPMTERGLANWLGY